jgi:hypothetical protein
MAQAFNGYAQPQTWTTAYTLYVAQPGIVEIPQGASLGPNLETAFKKMIQEVVKEEISDLKDTLTSLLKKRLVQALTRLPKGEPELTRERLIEIIAKNENFIYYGTAEGLADAILAGGK